MTAIFPGTEESPPTSRGALFALRLVNFANNALHNSSILPTRWYTSYVKDVMDAYWITWHSWGATIQALWDSCKFRLSFRSRTKSFKLCSTLAGIDVAPKLYRNNKMAHPDSSTFSQQYENRTKRYQKLASAAILIFFSFFCASAGEPASLGKRINDLFRIRTVMFGSSFRFTSLHSAGQDLEKTLF